MFNDMLALGATTGGGTIDVTQCTYEVKSTSWVNNATWEINVPKKPRAVFVAYKANTTNYPMGYYLFSADNPTQAYTIQNNSQVGIANITSEFTDTKVTLHRQGTAAYDINLACIIY